MTGKRVNPTHPTAIYKKARKANHMAVILNDLTPFLKKWMVGQISDCLKDKLVRLVEDICQNQIERMRNILLLLAICF